MADRRTLHFGQYRVISEEYKKTSGDEASQRPTTSSPYIIEQIIIMGNECCLGLVGCQKVLASQLTASQFRHYKQWVDGVGKGEDVARQMDRINCIGMVFLNLWLFIKLYFRL